jgi:cell division protein FtsB
MNNITNQKISILQDEVMNKQIKILQDEITNLVELNKDIAENMNALVDNQNFALRKIKQLETELATVGKMMGIPNLKLTEEELKEVEQWVGVETDRHKLTIANMHSMLNDLAYPEENSNEWVDEYGFNTKKQYDLLMKVKYPNEIIRKQLQSIIDKFIKRVDNIQIEDAAYERDKHEKRMSKILAMRDGIICGHKYYIKDHTLYMEDENDLNGDGRDFGFINFADIVDIYDKFEDDEEATEKGVIVIEFNFCNGAGEETIESWVLDEYGFEM